MCVPASETVAEKRKTRQFNAATANNLRDILHLSSLARLLIRHNAVVDGLNSVRFHCVTHCCTRLHDVLSDDHTTVEISRMHQRGRMCETRLSSRDKLLLNRKSAVSST